MAYFANDMETINLCVLYMLKKLNAKVTAPQLITALTEATGLSYFDAQLAIAELEDKGFIASTPGVRGSQYSLSSNGNNMLFLLQTKLPRSIRSDCEEYATKYRSKILNLGFFSAYNSKNPSGGHNVFLSSMDNERIILSLQLNVADAATAEKMCKNWENCSGSVYKSVYDALLNAPADKQE